jgi:hypothetical protein
MSLSVHRYQQRGGHTSKSSSGKAYFAITARDKRALANKWEVIYEDPTNSLQMFFNRQSATLALFRIRISVRTDPFTLEHFNFLSASWPSNHVGVFRFQCGNNDGFKTVKETSAPFA